MIFPRSESASHLQGFADFESFADAVGAWDVDFIQLGQGPFEAQLATAATPNAVLVEGVFHQKIEQRGAAPPGCRTFGIPMADGVGIRWRGTEADSAQIMRFPKGGELNTISDRNFHVFAYSVSEVALEQVAERRGMASVEALFGREDVAWYPTELREKIRVAAGHLSRCASKNPLVVKNRWFREEFERGLLELVLEAFLRDTGKSGFRPPAHNRSRALKKALEIIGDKADEPVTVAELENESGVSGRTLRYAFEEAYGLSPKRYLQAYRLDRVRRELCLARHSGRCVSDIANNWGFWHMGQFAADYRKQFGERPSETLLQP